jgi:hypothetical protein
VQLLQRVFSAALQLAAFSNKNRGIPCETRRKAGQLLVY